MGDIWGTRQRAWPPPAPGVLRHGAKTGLWLVLVPVQWSWSSICGVSQNAYTKLGCFPVVLQQSSLEYACSSCICTAGFAAPNLEQTRCAAADDRWQPQWSQQQRAPSCPSCCGDSFAPDRQPVRARGGCTQQRRNRRRGDSGQQQPQCAHLASCGWSEPAAGCRQARGCTQLTLQRAASGYHVIRLSMRMLLCTHRPFTWQQPHSVDQHQW
jgi:hypothetical protein